MNVNIGFSRNNATKENKVLEATEDGGTGTFFNLHVGDVSVLTDNSHLKYMR